MAPRSVLNTGPSSNRVDIFFLGDGYTKAELGLKYNQDIKSYISYLFDNSALTQPFGRYKNFFNVYAVDVVSAQSGADNPKTGTFVDTALDARYYFDGVTERLLYVNDTKANAALAGALKGTTITADMKYVLVNSTLYGGGGGTYGVYAAGNASAREVALHEIGHSFAGLADEYGGYDARYPGSEPSQPNVTKDPAGAKWGAWLGYNDPILGRVGAYEGGVYYNQGVYRPTDDSKMRSLERPFDPIARETFIRKFYALVDPIDTHTPNAGIRFEMDRLKVDVIDPAVIKVDWTVNGTVFRNVGETFSLKAKGFAYGRIEVTARAYDPTDWVRGNRKDLEERVSWTVVNPLADDGSTDFNGNGISDILFRDKVGGVTAWFLDAKGKIGSAAKIGTVAASLTVEGTGDFNGDGRSDVLFRDKAGNLSAWLFDGKGKLGASYTVGQAKAAGTVEGTGDFNGDGRADILFRDKAGALNAWFLDAKGKIGSAAKIGTVAASVTVEGTGDFNGDGRADILFREGTSKLTTWLLDGAGKVAAARTVGTAASAIEGTGDFNGDGREDILFQDGTGKVALWLFDAKGKVASKIAIGKMDAAWEVEGTGDYNGDGRTDVLWHDTAGHVNTWLLDGHGRVADSHGVGTASDWLLLA